MGRSSPRSPRTRRATRLPAREVSGADVRDLRFQQVLRGYRMAEVDWVLDRLAGELTGPVRRHELADRAPVGATIARMRAEEDPGDGQRQQW